MSYAKSLLDKADTFAHLTSSQAECARSAGGLRPLGQGRMCPVFWDGWLCWPPTLGGATIKQPCPAFTQFDTQQFVYRKCMPNGTWFEMSNYTSCLLSSAATVFTIGTRSSTTTGYDAAVGIGGHDPKGSTASLRTSSVAHSLDVAYGDVTAPTDDVIGAVLHGISAVCLLLALVTWVSLKLTDRIVTRRYLVLMATVVMTFLFHTIVMTSRMRAVAVALADQSGASFNGPSGPGSERAATTQSPAGAGLITPLPLRSAAMVLNEEETDRFMFYESDVSSREGIKKADGRKAPAANSLDGIMTDKGLDADVHHPGLKLFQAKYREKRDDGRVRGTKQKRNVVEEKSTTSKGSNNDDDSPDAKPSSQESWLTLCQVGRAFYLLTDMSIYSFLFAMSLYYTMVVLGNELTFNKLVTMFLLGLGLPVVFVTFTILLYTFLPTPAAFGVSCTIDSLTDEFHWAITGPKLLCIVLSMCLMTVSTYGFWRLHVPALRASSETFYARQGVLKTLALLLSCSLAELFLLVTEYQKMYGWPTNHHVLHACTAVFGLKGSVLAFLFCFMDSEVLHGTCCPSTFSDGEPWLQGAALADIAPGTGDRRRSDEGDGERIEFGYLENNDIKAGGIASRWGEPDVVHRNHDVIGTVGMGEKV